MCTGDSINVDFTCNNFTDTSNVLCDNLNVDHVNFNVHHVSSVDVQLNQNVHVPNVITSVENVDDNLSNFTHTFYHENLGLMNHSLTLPYFPVNFRTVNAPVGGRLSLFYENYELLT